MVCPTSTRVAMNRPRFLIGLDLGKSHDPTAIAILERKELIGEWDPVMYAHKRMVAMQLRYLERIPLGTSYPDVVKHVEHIARSADLRKQCYLMVDATGVGPPVVGLQVLLQRGGLQIARGMRFGGALVE